MKLYDDDFCDDNVKKIGNKTQDFLGGNLDEN